MKRVAINGFGRIGRTFLSIALSNPNMEIVAINDLADIQTLAHLFKYDSIHGGFKGSIEVKNATELIINGHTITFFSKKEIAELNWEALNIDIVIEATGRNLTSASAGAHINSGAKAVIISAPSTDDTPMIVLGINDSILATKPKIISNASCTTNNAAPLVKVLDDNFGIADGYITTIHSYTTDQNLHDAPHKDLRRARAAALNIIPTSTGAAKAITNIFPHLDGKLGGAGIRVPVPNGSLTDFTCWLRTDNVTVDDINLAFKNAADTYLKNYLEYTNEPIVSIDVINNPHSCVFDAQLTSVVGNLVKVVGWYDNEYGYSSRLVNLVEKL